MRYHFTPKEINDSVHQITIMLIGIGGTGSHLAEALARMDRILRLKGKQGLHVTLVDDDNIEEHNIGRQNFIPAENGMSKVNAMTTRLNHIYGLNWDCIEGPHQYGDLQYNIIITCVDNMKTRRSVGKALTDLVPFTTIHDSRKKFLYWIDTGNEKNTGQVLVGSTKIEQPQRKKKYITCNKLPFPHELVDMTKIRDRKSANCSIDMALKQQSLFINSTIAQFVGNLLYQMIVEKVLSCNGCYINLKKHIVKPILI